MKGTIKLVTLSEVGIVPTEKMKFIFKRGDYIEADLELNKIKEDPCDYKYWIGLHGASVFWTNNPNELTTLIVKYSNQNWDEYSTSKPRYFQIPINPDQHKKIIENNLVDKNVDFEEIEIYVEPPDSIHCNRGGYRKEANVIFSSKWDVIFEEFKNFNSSSDMTPIAFVEFLKQNYKIPEKKIE